MDMLYVLAVIAIALTIIYYYLTWNYDFWKNQGVDYVPNVVPGFGNIARAIFVKENLGMMCSRFYNIATDSSMIGFFFLRTPALLVKDPELVKTVLVTNFTNFRANMFQITENDRLLMQNPFFSKDEAWKISRTRLTNLFSSKKLRAFFEVINGVSFKLTNFVDRKIKENKDVYEVELKELFAKFTGEVTANAGYGIEGHCFEDNPRPDSFADVAKKVFDVTVIDGFEQAALFYVPKLASLLGFRFISKKVEHFFIDIAKTVMESRKDKDYNKHNVVQFTMDTLEEPDLIVMAGQLMSFFADTYITSSVAAAFTAYHLADNPTIQQTAREDIFNVLNRHKGSLSYEAIKEMTYVDQVLNESLRINPPATVLMKYCTDECTLKGSDGQSCVVKPGTLVSIPIHSLHMDEKYWSDPDTFNPDRFHPDKKEDIVKYTHMPFGEGPRACVGMRLAIMQVKIMIITMLRNYSMEVSPKTQTPLKMDPKSLLLSVEGGLWARLKRLE